MDREWLARRLEDGASYEAIARELGCSPSKVSYWAQRYELTSVHAPLRAARGRIQQEVLESLIAEGLAVRGIAERLGRSPAGVRYWIARYGLTTHAAIERAARARAAADAQGDFRVCRVHGLTRHYSRASGFRCGRCSAEQVSARRRRVKQILVEEAGGRCTLCGYDRCVRALEFHHVDPGSKRFAIAHRGLAQSMAKIRAEAAKCVLLCSNCHAEVEEGLADV